MTLATLSNQIKELKELMLSEKTKMMTAEDAAKYLGFSIGYLYRLTSKDAITRYKPNGKKIFFEKADLDKWIRRKRVFTKEELESNA